jgi:biopolymer transport protein ExbD
VDVMLVLFVIFLVTAPMLTHTVQLELPKVAESNVASEGEINTLAIDSEGLLYWNDAPQSFDMLEVVLKQSAETQPTVPIELHIDKSISYAQISKVLSLAQQLGLSHLGFVMESQ